MKQLCAALVIVLLIAGIVIGATVFVTRKTDKIVNAFVEAGNKFERVAKIFEDNKVTGLTRRVVNPANIIKVSEYAFPNGKESGGLKVTYDADGVITLDGKCDKAFAVCLGEYYVLEGGKYTVNVIADEPARTTTAIKIVASDDTLILNKKFSEPTTFDSTELQYVKVYIEFKYGDEFNQYRIAPVLVSGTNMGTFYVNETVPVDFN